MYNLYNWFHEAFSANLAPCLLSYSDSLQVVFKATWINHKPANKVQDLKAEGVTAQVECFQKMEWASQCLDSNYSKRKVTFQDNSSDLLYFVVIIRQVKPKPGNNHLRDVCQITTKQNSKYLTHWEASAKLRFIYLGQQLHR